MPAALPDPTAPRLPSPPPGAPPGADHAGPAGRACSARATGTGGRAAGSAAWPRLAGLLRRGGLGLALVWLMAWPLAPAWAQEVRFSLARAVDAPADGGEPDWALAEVLPLPDEWSQSRPGYTGERRYRLTFSITDGVLLPERMFGLYIERACSSLAVVVNGQLVHQGGRLEPPVSRNCHRPQLVALPSAVLREGSNQVELRLVGHALTEVSSRQRAAGLSTVVFGQHEALKTRHVRRTVLAVRLPEVLSGTLLLMGGFMFVMGWFNRAQSYLAYFGALMVGWAVLLARLWVTDLPLPNPVVEATLAVLTGFITWAAVQFLLRYAGERVPWIDRAMPAQCALIALSLAVAGADHLHAVSVFWFALMGLELLAAAGHHLAAERARGSAQFWPMAVLMGLVTAAITIDGLSITVPMDPRIGYLAQLVPSLVFIVLGLRLVQQFGRAYQSAEQHRAELEVRIREATAQIERNFAQLAELKVEQVTDRERKRIAADLHDDLGAKLLTIVHTSESERISTLAREALEEMRLSVRGLTGKPVKLADALGDWRAEVVLRLQQAGVQGEWLAPADEEDLPMTLSSRAYVQTTRILREAVSNIIKHSGASACTIRCAIETGDFVCVIQDNGKGISVDVEGRLDKGHGLASMKGRAKQLQGQCLVESSPGYGTVIRLTLPLEPLLTNG